MKKSTMAILSVVVVVVLLIIGVIGWGVSANNKFAVLYESISAAESKHNCSAGRISSPIWCIQ